MHSNYMEDTKIDYNYRNEAVFLSQSQGDSLHFLQF